MEVNTGKKINKDFNAAVADINKAFLSTLALSTQLTKAGPKAVLSIPNPDGTSTPFGKKEMRQAVAAISDSLKDLKSFVRGAHKKARKPVEPESFSGVYTPVYVGEALRTFFTEANFGTTADKTPLVDQLGLVKGGYMLRNTITMLFYIHAYADSLQDPANAQLTHSSAAMRRAFDNKDIPAEFYTQKEKQVDGRIKTTKIRMVDAVAQGIPQMSTYDVIRASNPTFDPDHFKTYFFQNIASVNYHSIPDLRRDPDLTEAATFLEKEDVRAQMLAEHQLVKQVSAQWRALHEEERARKKASSA